MWSARLAGPNASVAPAGTVRSRPALAAWYYRPRFGTPSRCRPATTGRIHNSIQGDAA
ncbi:hypothetical protein PATSB16_09730 [Pandoraea thiooxydans]|nr:hypothetical protein PATSB16_09730 [Pandoraea thiooxydans]